MFPATVCWKVYFLAHLFGQCLRAVCVRPRVSNRLVAVGGGWGGFEKSGSISCDVPPDLRCLEPKIFIKTSASHLSTSFRSPAPDYSFLFIGLLAGTWKTFCLLKCGVLGSSRYQSHVFNGTPVYRVECLTLTRKVIVINSDRLSFCSFHLCFNRFRTFVEFTDTFDVQIGHYLFLVNFPSFEDALE